MEEKYKLDLVDAYDRYASFRDKDEVDPWKLEEREVFYQKLKNEGKKSVLDIGAGPGRDAKFFKDKGFKVVAIDISTEMVKLCKEKGLRAYVMDFFDLSFSDESFEAVWALNCLLHVPKANLPQVLEGIRRVLKPEGLFYMGVYGGPDIEEVWKDDFYYPKRFFSFFPDDRIQEVVSRYFKIEYFKTIPHKGDIHFQSMILRK